MCVCSCVLHVVGGCVVTVCIGVIVGTCMCVCCVRMLCMYDSAGIYDEGQGWMASKLCV